LAGGTTKAVLGLDFSGNCGILRTCGWFAGIGPNLSVKKLDLLTLGDELLLGLRQNTHLDYLGGEFARHGLPLRRNIVARDIPAEIEASFRDLWQNADVVVTTGGLGPTSDDITRDLIAKLLGRQLLEDASVLTHIRQFFEVRNRAMPERTSVQAQVPEGATVLLNPHGTAPGLAMEVRPNPFRVGGEASLLIMLPGPPRELRPMFIDTVGPLLRRTWPMVGSFVCRTLRTTGIGESVVEEKIGALLRSLTDSGLELGYCARPGEVDVRLAARCAGAAELVDKAERIVREQLEAHLFAVEDEELEATIVHLLTQRKETLALAESCTGGCIAHRLTNVPGASVVFLAGFVAYVQLPVSALPQVDYPTIQVQTFYPGASPEVMASSVTAPLERQFGQIPGLNQMTSTSSLEWAFTRVCRSNALSE